MYTEFQKIDDIMCIVGDSLSTMTITVEGMSASYSMTCNVYSLQGRKLMLSKSCTATSTGFTVQLTSTDMATVPVGAYWLDFVLTDQNSLLHKKLRGKLIVVEG